MRDVRQGLWWTSGMVLTMSHVCFEDEEKGATKVIQKNKTAAVLDFAEVSQKF
jgi:hypothetical protein